MGILNITPDSFYDGDNSITLDSLNNKFSKVIDADIIDVGCESSRPGAKSLSLQTELERFKIFIPTIKDNPKKIFSIDTCKYDVAKFAIKNGISIINDITAGRHDSRMFDLVSSCEVKIILMHMKGMPFTMQDNPKYKSVIDSIYRFFEARINEAIKKNIKIENIIIDPGIGFGKRISDNDEIVNNISKFKNFGCKILIGISRKSFLRHENNKPADRLPATLGVTALAINNGADIIRVHDVKETINMLNSLERIVKK